MNEAKAEESKAGPGREEGTDRLYPEIPNTRVTPKAVEMATYKVLVFTKPVQVWVLFLTTKRLD